MDHVAQMATSAQSDAPSKTGALNGGYMDLIPLEELEAELPVVDDAQQYLGDLLSRIVQAIYAELLEHSETMPNMSDTARKRTLADWVVKTKKQIAKLYAIAKWSRDAHSVQKSMNITAFLLTQNQQFQDVVQALKYAKESLDPARLRNHDLLTSLDILTTGSYLALPTCVKTLFPRSPLTNAEVDKTFFDIEESIRYRLRMSEIIPMEMANYCISNGQAHFTVEKLFKTSICLRTVANREIWFMVDVEFFINVGGDLTRIQDFPRKPSNIMKKYITDEGNTRLSLYLPLTADLPLPDSVARPQLPEGVVDTPLVRLYNFLQMMSLSYQLEILWYQAERMRSLGWANYLSIEMSKDRKTLKAQYWLRPPVPQLPGRPSQKIPRLGGTLTIAIVEKHSSSPMLSRKGSEKAPYRNVMARLQQRSKLGTLRPSDDVERLCFDVHWEIAKGAFGVIVDPDEVELTPDMVCVYAGVLDFEPMLQAVIQKHANAILTSFRKQLQHSRLLSSVGVVDLILDDKVSALRVQLCSDEFVIITLDTRTGKFNIRCTADLAVAGREIQFSAFSDKINENPMLLDEALIKLRLMTILDFVEQKATYLGLRSYRHTNIPKEEMVKLGPDARSTLFIQLAKFTDHYLVIVITDERFKYALITTKTMERNLYVMMVLEDIAWLDSDRIRDAWYNDHSTLNFLTMDVVHRPEKIGLGFDLSSRSLKELYNYCCARVAFMTVERQLKLRKIPFKHVNPAPPSQYGGLFSHMQSSLARSVPALCVQSEHILSGAPAAEAAMPNIRVIPLNWWSHGKARVVTCVKLKYVQQPMGKTGMGSTVIRPSKRLIYDTREAIVSFLSEDVNSCVDEFLEEWARVSKMVVIAREVAQMGKESKWSGVRLLSFDLQTVEFTYAQDYVISISCEDQLSSTGGNFDLVFSRMPLAHDAMDTGLTTLANPHQEAEPYYRHILRYGHGKLAHSLHQLVTLLRETLPIVVELEKIRYGNDTKLHAFSKSAAWYRLLYRNFKHGLDFRLMSEQRIAILDAAHSLNKGDGKSSSAVDDLVLQPIPQFREIVASAVRDACSSGTLASCKIAVMEVGIISDPAGIKALADIIHSRVLDRIFRS